jgi:tetratricopeptide (TPR) repeat protein
LEYLGILKFAHSPEMAGGLNSLQRYSETNALMVAQVASWMAANGMIPEATNWLARLPDNLRSQPPVQLAMANCYLVAENWRALCDFTSKGSWGGIDFMRLAFLSRAWSKLGEPLVADSDWDSAVSSAGNQLGELNTLLEFANNWDLKSKQEDLLLRILRIYPQAVWAQHKLEQLYFTTGNTRGMYQLFQGQFLHSTNDMKLKNDIACTALLLKTNLNAAYAQAAEVYGQAPNDPAIVTTYAYAMYLQGRNAEGLAALQKLSEAQLTQPSIALYYALLLSANGKSNEAQPYLEIAKTAPLLLPEEKKILAELSK